MFSYSEGVPSEQTKHNDPIFLFSLLFETEQGREAHLNGPIAAALMANASSLLAKDPILEKVDLLAIK